MVDMSLNIKNERVHALARDAASRTGLSQTAVIEVALEQLLAGLVDTPDPAAIRLARATEILGDIHTRLSPEQRASLTTDDLYDDAGLPA